MFRPKPNLPLSQAIYGLSALLFLAATAPQAKADAENYTKTLGSTAWIITSDADGETSTGTGVLVDDEKRLVLTNAHVVGDSRSAVVFFPDMKNGLPEVKRKHYLENVVKLAQPGKVVAIDRQVSMGANNHPAMYLLVRFSTDGSLPAGLPVKINGDNN